MAWRGRREGGVGRREEMGVEARQEKGKNEEGGDNDSWIKVYFTHTMNS